MTPPGLELHQNWAHHFRGASRSKRRVLSCVLSKRHS